MSVKTNPSEGKTVPVQRDSRTFEQRRRDFVQNLERTHSCDELARPKSQQSGQMAAPSSMSHEQQLRSGEWLNEVNHWIDKTNKFWNYDWGRTWRNMFSLVPVDRFDMDPLHTFGLFGSPNYIPSIFARMDSQMQSLRTHMEQLIPDYRPGMLEQADHDYGQGALLPRGGLLGGALDYLKDAYEPGDDGQLRFKLRFDLRGYGPDDIRVETAENRLTVHAKKMVKSDGSMQTSEFCRTLYLPDKVDGQHFTSHLSQDGILTVEAPVKQSEVCAIKYDRDRQLGIQPHAGSKDLALQPMGKPGPTILSDGPGAARLHVEVPVEPGFTSGDLHVSTVGSQLVVSGQHKTEEEFGSSGKGVHVREFQRSYPIPQAVDPLSLQARLFDQTLVVEGPLVQKTP